jgi:glycosyltransferase involved in cell wall biosynthesis
MNLNRSEGLGQNILEPLFLGKPVLSTAYSGPADFLTEEGAYPVRYTLPQNKFQSWVSEGKP